MFLSRQFYQLFVFFVCQLHYNKGSSAINFERIKPHEVVWKINRSTADSVQHHTLSGKGREKNPRQRLNRQKRRQRLFSFYLTFIFCTRVHLRHPGVFVFQQRSNSIIFIQIRAVSKTTNLLLFVANRFQWRGKANPVISPSWQSEAQIWSNLCLLFFWASPNPFLNSYSNSWFGLRECPTQGERNNSQTRVWMSSKISSQIVATIGGGQSVSDEYLPRTRPKLLQKCWVWTFSRWMKASLLQSAPSWFFVRERKVGRKRRAKVDDTYR